MSRTPPDRTRYTFDRRSSVIRDAATGEAICICDLRDRLRAGERFRVGILSTGEDCTVEILMRLLGPVLARANVLLNGGRPAVPHGLFGLGSGTVPDEYGAQPPAGPAGDAAGGRQRQLAGHHRCH